MTSSGSSFSSGEDDGYDDENDIFSRARSNSIVPRYTVVPDIPSRSKTRSDDFNPGGSESQRTMSVLSVLPPIGQIVQPSTTLYSRQSETSGISSGYAEFDVCRVVDTVHNDELEGLKKTRIYNLAKDQLNSQKVVLLSGSPGSGKSSIGILLCKEFQDLKFNVFRVSSVTSLWQNISGNKNDFIFIDDVFDSKETGSETITVLLQKMNEFNLRNQNKGRTNVLLTSRISIVPLRLPSTLCHINIENESTNSDLVEIVQHFVDTMHARVNTSDVITYYGATTDDIGLPLCMHCFTHYFEDIGLEFFCSPLQYIIDKFYNLVNNSNFARCMALIMSLSGGKLHITTVLEADDSKRVLRERCVTNNEFNHSIHQKDLRCFIQKSKETFKFVHPELLLLSETLLFQEHGTSCILKLSVGTLRYVQHFNISEDKLVERLLTGILECEVSLSCESSFWDQVASTFRLDASIRQQKENIYSFLYKIFTIEDRLRGHGVIYWSAFYTKRQLCSKLLQLYQKCSKNHELPRSILSDSLVGACLHESQAMLISDLIKHGADVSYCAACTDNKDNTNGMNYQSEHLCPLQAVIRSGNLKSLKFLLKHGATIPHSKWSHWHFIANLAQNTNVFDHSFDFIKALDQTFSNFANKSEYSPTNLSNSTEFETFCQILCNVVSPHDLGEICSCFIKSGFINGPICKSFIESGLEINERIDQGRDCLNLIIWQSKQNLDSISQNFLNSIQVLLAYGIDPNALASDGSCPLSLTVYKKSCNIEVLEMLLNYGADVNQRNNLGFTTLYLYLKSNIHEDDKLRAVTLMKSYQPSLNLVDSNGNSIVHQLLNQNKLSLRILIELSNYPIHDCLSSLLEEPKKYKMLLLLQQDNIDVNLRNDQNDTPISIACCNTLNVSCTKLLIKHKADLNMLYNAGASIIQKVLMSSHVNVNQMTQLLLESQCKITHLDEHQNNVVMSALISERKRYNDIRMILDQWPANKRSFLANKNRHNQNVLHLICKCNFLDDCEALELCRTFIFDGVEVNLADESSKTPLEYASLCEEGRRETILLLLEHTYNTSINGISVLANLIDNGHMCETILSALSNKRYFLKLVAENEFTLNELVRCKPMTFGYIDGPLKHLIKAGANINNRNQEGNTPLHIACSKTINRSIIQCLLQNGANANQRNNKGNTALHDCLKSKPAPTVFKAICDIFTYNAFNFDLRNNDEQTVLDMLTRELTKEWLPCFRTLLDLTNDIEWLDESENSLMHIVVDLDEVDTVVADSLHIILNSKHLTDINHQNAEQQTPLNIACCNASHLRISTITYLLSQGADTNIRDYKGYSPLQNVLNNLQGRELVLSLERFTRVMVLALHMDNASYCSEDFKYAKEICKKHHLSDVLSMFGSLHDIDLLQETYEQQLVKRIAAHYRNSMHEYRLKDASHLNQSLVKVIEFAYKRICNMRIGEICNMEMQNGERTDAQSPEIVNGSDFIFV